MKTGLRIQYENPQEIGADRIVNAVAAIQSYGLPVIIVDFGTATTFSLINKEGYYVGGAITPGVAISLQALHQKTAKLTRVEITKPESVIGRDVVTSIQAGIFFGYASMVDGIVNQMKSLLYAKPTVVATGGLAGLICSETTTIDQVDPLLTLRGLKQIYEWNY